MSKLMEHMDLESYRSGEIGIRKHRDRLYNRSGNIENSGIIGKQSLDIQTPDKAGNVGI